MKYYTEKLQRTVIQYLSGVGDLKSPPYGNPIGVKTSIKNTIKIAPEHKK